VFAKAVKVNDDPKKITVSAMANVFFMLIRVATTYAFAQHFFEVLG
jgi:hypothetical protein